MPKPKTQKIRLRVTVTTEDGEVLESEFVQVAMTPGRSLDGVRAIGDACDQAGDVYRSALQIAIARAS